MHDGRSGHPEEPQRRKHIDSRPAPEAANPGQSSGRLPYEPAAQTPTDNPGPVEQPNNQEPQQDQEATPPPQTPAMPNPEPPTDSNTPAQSESHSVKMVNLIERPLIGSDGAVKEQVIWWSHNSGQQVEVVAIKSRPPIQNQSLSRRRRRVVSSSVRYIPSTG